MLRTEIDVCHRKRLFSECLAASLTHLDRLSCTVLQPEVLLPACTAPLPLPLELLLLDATLEGDTSYHVAETLRRRSPDCKLLLMVAESAVGSMVELARFGSHGCLFEEVSLVNVCAAIDTVLSGRPFCSPELANALMAQIGRVDRDNPWSRHVDDVQLTVREREVLELIAGENLGNKQIARRLGVSLYTVKNHVHNLIEKLGVPDRHEAVRLARRRKMIVADRFESQELRAVRLPR